VTRPVEPERVAVAYDGLTFDVRLSGPEDGPLLLLLHGFPQTGAAWRAVVPPLAAHGLRCAVMTQRGYGDAARPAAVEAYAMDRLVADALAVADAVGDGGSFDVAGHDWGASVGWSLAARRPDRVRSLTAASVPHLAAYGQAVRDDAEQRSMVAYIGRLRRDADAADQLLADDARGLRRMVGPRLPADALDRYLGAVGHRAGLDGALAWYRANGPELHRLGPIAVPTTFVWGAHDPFIGAAAARACGAHVTADYRYVELADVGHWIPEEAPATLAAEIALSASAGDTVCHTSHGRMKVRRGSRVLRPQA
jgi:pimeloyl-ACP methyl ester carboxylesterase